MRKKALIFDCFGVLYPQASKNFFTRYQHLFKNGYEIFDKLNFQIDLGKITRKEFFTGVEKEIGMPADKIQNEIDRELIFDRELVEFIKKQKNSYKIGLLSNAGQDEISIIYDDKIDSIFDTKVVSYEVGIVKPNPELYLLCAKRLGVLPEECIFIDDSPSCISGAESVGISSILFKDTKQLKVELLKYGIN